MEERGAEALSRVGTEMFLSKRSSVPPYLVKADRLIRGETKMPNNINLQPNNKAENLED